MSRTDCTLLVQGWTAMRGTRSYRGCSLSRALSARDEWDAVLALARDRDSARRIERRAVGSPLDDGDSFVARPPRSFGKLTRFLYERASHFRFDRSKG